MSVNLNPLWLDLAGSTCVVISLLFLIRKHIWYWHFSNLSLLPYFLLFVSGGQYMLAGLQISYLLFGLHGLYLWILEQRRDQQDRGFNEGFWYNLGWVMTLAIFVYTVSVTRFEDGWAWLQFAATALSLIANWGTTRRWIWSWYVWLIVNVLQSVLFFHLNYWPLFGLQFILAALSLRGLMVWRHDRVHHA